MATRDIGALRTRLSWEDDGANRSLEGFKRDLKGLRSEMRLAQSGGKDYTNSLKGMREQSDVLSRRFKTQQQQVRELKRRYEEAKAVKGEDAVQTQNLAAQYNRAAAEMNNTENQLKNLNEEIRRQESPWTKMGEKMTDAGTKMQDFGRGMTDFGKSYTMRVTTPIVAGATAMVKSAIDYESAFAGVRKTVDMSEEGYAKLSQGIRDMAKQLPTSAVDIAAVAESAGQLGIKNENILGFTKTIIDLGEATNMTREQAATEFARFANIVGMPQDAFDRLGSSVVELGNNMATTESEIVRMGMRLAAQGSQVGMSEAQIMALAATMSSLGIEAEAGGTAMTMVLKKIDRAVGEGGDSLADFAKASGTSSKEFADAWKKDPIGALDLFINGLSDSADEGKNLTSILTDLGIKGIRESDTILRMAGASDILSDAVKMSSGAWKENSALTNEAAERYATTESQIKVLWNRVKDIAITLGEALVPALMDALAAAEPLFQKIEEGAQSFAEMDEEQQRTILNLIAFIAAVGPAAIVVGQLTTAIGGVLKIGGSFSTMIGKAGGTGLAGSIGLLSKAGVVGLAIAGVGALGYAIYNLVKDSKELHDVSTDTAKSLGDQANELKANVDVFDKLSAKASLSNEQLAELHELNKKIADSNSPGEIQALQEQYDALAEKSGLSKDELNELFTANDYIIAQAPDVQAAVSDTGTQFVENTEAINEYIAGLYEMARVELESEREKNLENQATIQKEINSLQEDQNKNQRDLQLIQDLQNMSRDELIAKEEELQARRNDVNTTSEELVEIDDELALIASARKDTLGEERDLRLETLESLRDSLASEEEKLAITQAFDEEYANILLKQVGINEEGAKGLEQLDKSIAKNQEELSALDEKLSVNGSLSEEEQNRHDKLQENITAQQDIKNHLYNELGLYTDINSLIEGKLAATDEETRKKIENLAATRDINVEEGKILEQLQSKNSELVEERSNLIENLKQQGATTEEIDQQVAGIDNKISKNDGVIITVLQELGLWEDIKDQINLGSDAITGQGYGIDSNNTKTKIGIGLEEDRTAEAAKSVEKDVKAMDRGTVRAIDIAAGSGVIKPVDADDFGSVAAIDTLAKLRVGKPVDANDYGTIADIDRRAGKTVTKKINVSAVGVSGAAGKILAGYAKGTPAGGHKGGEFLAGEEGWELGRMGKRWEFLNFGLYDRPRGYEVFTHDESKKIVRALNNMQKPSVPGYATGASSPGEANRVISNLNQDNNNWTSDAVISLLREIARGVNAAKVMQANGREIAAVVNEENAFNELGKVF